MEAPGAATWRSEGVYVERSTPDGSVREVVFERPLPVQLIEAYARLAAIRSRATELDDGSWFAEVPGFSGVWADGMTEDDARAAVETVVFDWALLKIADGDRDLPPVGAINLNTI